MSYFAADEKYLANEEPASPPTPPAARPVATPGPQEQSAASRYFKADESSLSEPAAAAPAPWNLRLRESPTEGRVLLTWQQPYAQVDAFVIEGRQGAGEWLRLAECAGQVSEAALQPGVGG